MYTKIGLILGDSILHGYFEQDDKLVTEMRNIYDLDIVKTSFQKGVTTSVLVHKAFPREMAELLKKNDCNILVDIFLISGAVDLSNSISDESHFNFDSFISKRNEEFKIFVDHPLVRRLIIYPLTPRGICRNDLKKRFPKYAVASWVSSANKHIQYVNKSDFLFHSKLRYLKPLPDTQLIQQVAKDGIHLTLEGRKLFARSVLGVEDKKIFSLDEFPPLPSRIRSSPLQSIDTQIEIFEAKFRDK